VSSQTIKAEVLAVPPSQAVQNAVQEGKIHSARQAIKEHVRSSDPKFAAIFPVKNSKITLSPAEVEAFKAEYQGEKSFRADYANVLMTIVAYLSRMVVEVDEYNQKAGSAYLWKPHADALSYLVSTLERLGMEAEQVMAVARARGLQEKATALATSLDKLKEYAKTVSQTLQSGSHAT
jgi:type VI protein secretion system component VasF